MELTEIGKHVQGMLNACIACWEARDSMDFDGDLHDALDDIATIAYEATITRCADALKGNGYAADDVYDLGLDFGDDNGREIFYEYVISDYEAACTMR